MLERKCRKKDAASVHNTAEQAIIYLQVNKELFTFLKVKLNIFKCDFSASTSWRCSSQWVVHKSYLVLLKIKHGNNQPLRSNLYVSTQLS